MKDREPLAGPSSRRVIGQALMAAVVLSLVLGLLSWMQWRQQDQIDVLSGQVRELGGVPLVSPAPSRPGTSPRPGPSGPSGAAGRDGRDGRTPSTAQVSAAVARYLREHPPPRGRAPTMAEIITAVTGYLRANPPPAGPSGPPGEDGEDGAPGRDGRDGPPPSEEQVRAVVQAYLESNPLNCPTGSSMGRLSVVTTGGTREIVVCVEEGAA
ncbi:hypothetical protein [Actinomadura sp. 21ATH]|uniref:hypothetical protein n=1 Tax=Actinomadura sp. 21ATH TaxID=1735444 RepID=UPI0035BFFC77